MAYTLQQTINFSEPFIEYSPLTAGTGFEPALSIATMVRNTIMNAPFSWPWNRNEYLINNPNTPNSLTAGVQDYTFPITDFAYLEKVSLLSADGSYGFEVSDVYNTGIMGVPSLSTEKGQPNAAAVRYYIPGTSVALRFMSVPDQAYTGVITYQKLPLPFQVFSVASAGLASGGQTAYTGVFNPASFVTGQSAQFAGFTNAANNGSFSIVSCTATVLTVSNAAGVAETISATVINEGWFPIPDSFSDIYINLFLAEAMASVDDGREQLYRQRGIAALLSKAEGLSDMQVNAFLAQWMTRGSLQMISSQTKMQQGNQARAL